jgi:hypothetical protein
VRWAIIVLSVAVVLPGCQRRNDASPSHTTQTVAPAAAQPAPAGNDAMTQTVNVDDGRSEEEGAAAVSDSASRPGKPAPTAKTAKPAKKHR